MKIIAQVVSEASVRIREKTVGKINRGFVLLVGFAHDDNKETVIKMVDKLISLRIFPDENGLTNRSLNDIQGEILSVSQFTLYADMKKGRRPSFIKAMRSEFSSALFDFFNELIGTNKIHVEKGIFGADMQVHLVNDGPFTVILDSHELFGGVTI